MNTNQTTANSLAELAPQAKTQSLFALLRWLDAKHPNLPLLGRSVRAHQDPVRLAQHPSMVFAPSEVQEIACPPDQKPTVRSNHFGLFGPNGPLPMHYTEHAHLQQHAPNGPQSSTQANPSLGPIPYKHKSTVAFADVFHHRLQSLFYRAWANTQAVLDFDRPGEQGFKTFVASLCGHASPAPQEPLEQDALGSAFKLKHCSLFAKHVRSAHSLQQLLQSLLQVPAQVQEHVFGFMALDAKDCNRLGQQNSSLGRSFTLGQRVPDVQHGFSIKLGPLNHAQYQSFAPGSAQRAALHALVNNWVGLDCRWHVELCILAQEAPPMQLGQKIRLGFEAWLHNSGSTSCTLAGARLPGQSSP